MHSSPEFRRGVYNNLHACLQDPLISQHFLGSNTSSFEADFRLPTSRHPAFLNWNNFDVSKSSSYSDSDVFAITIFGELGGRNQGTRISAKGDSLGLNAEAVVTDKTTCRNAYALAMPTLPTIPIYNAYNNQIARICNNELTDTPLQTFVDPEETVITAWGTPIYRHAERTGRRVTSVMRPDIDKSWQYGNDTFENLRGGNQYGEFAIANVHQLKAEYAVSRLPDFTGLPAINLTSSVLRQPEIYDANNKLVKPWQLKDVLTEGTLLLVEGSFNLRGRYDEKQKFRFLAQTITVIDSAGANTWQDEYD
ncbi:hypothetical protein BJ165DRAFT_1397437 [Panaeolus papilionaceus]|nr:hypothetical protein BJ165DRAFT_1397437 [Panaeolus papilionaceus]